MEKELIKEYKDQIKDMTKEQAIEHLEELKFMIDMIDRWDQNDKIAWNVLSNLIKELKED